MEFILNIISNPAFINFISTFGLATLLVIYFIFMFIPKRDAQRTEMYENLIKRECNKYDELLKNYEDKYEHLLKSYEDLCETYSKLENDIKPQTRRMSNSQAKSLCFIALDRDLYKLYCKCCEKLDGRLNISIDTILKESIVNTNEVWAKFTSPFPLVSHITNLYGLYSNNGGKFKEELENFFVKSQSTNKEDKNNLKDDLWNMMYNNTISMIQTFNQDIYNLERGVPVEPYTEH